MKLKDIVEELYDSSVYKDFVRDFPGAFFSAAFFILDVKEKSEKIQLDFFVPSERKVVAFEFPFSVYKMFDEEIFSMTELVVDVKLDFDGLVDECNRVIAKNNSSIKPTKIIAVLKDNVWNLTAMDDMLGIVRLKIDALSGECKDFSKGSLMDFMGIQKGKK